MFNLQPWLESYIREHLEKIRDFIDKYSSDQIVDLFDKIKKLMED